MQVAKGWWVDSRAGSDPLTSHRLYEEPDKATVPRFAACGARVPMGWAATEGWPVNRCQDCLLATQPRRPRGIEPSWISGITDLRPAERDHAVLAQLEAWEGAHRAAGLAAAQYLANWIGSGQPRNVRDRDAMVELDLRACEARSAYFATLT
jgi:hypothetical protein